MLCYRDMTFCTHYKRCIKSKECGRPLTPRVMREAQNWMKDPPICMFAERPECFVEEPLTYEKRRKQNEKV